MKTKHLLKALTLSLILVGCAKSPKQANFQQQSAMILSKYTGGVSRGFAGSSSSRGAYYDSSTGGSAYNGYVMRQDTAKEVQDCVTMVQQVPKDCANYQYVISSLSRCLDRLLTYRNPIYTNAFQSLDRTGQQYWTYLLDWRRPRAYQNFSTNDYNQIAPYAASGYIQNDLQY